ncbi:MAG: hypothetical protein C0467_02630 [Planctomycetaceae bacterium]|nr:hypothetical protein [Planctomycetaceae bacterium]
MLRCTECRPLILDHLFGLLDAPEIAAVAAHLSTCPACASERAEAAKVHGLIAQAAKIAFPAVRFEAPDARTAAAKSAASLAKTSPMVCNAIAAPLPSLETRTPVTPAAKNQRSSRHGGATKAPSGTGSRIALFLPWAVAAAVLVAVPGTIVPVSNLLKNAEVARRDASESTARAAEALRVFESTGREVDIQRAAAHNALVAAKQAHDGLLAKWVADEKIAAQTQDTRKLTWEVMKPAAVQPGAPNEFLLVINNRGNTPSGHVVAEFRDQTDAVIHSQPIDQDRDREHPIRLPAGAWTKLKPDSELFLVVSRVDDKTNERTVLQDKVRLLGPVFTTVLTTDKPTYWPGETVRFRSLTLDRVTFTPPNREQLLHYELRGPNGALVRSGTSNGTLNGSTDMVRVIEGKVTPVMGPDNNPVRGVGAGEFSLPMRAPEGEYTLIMRELPNPSGNPSVIPFPVTRTIRVESGTPEVFNKRITFGAASYVAGDTVEAWVEMKHKDQPVVGAQVLSAIAVIDNQVLEVVDLQPRPTDDKGRTSFQFVLPAAIAQGDARLKVVVRGKNGNDFVEEPVANRIPVVGPNLVVEFFPEGGDLVAGVPCRVYVRATTPSGLPVDISGTITDGRRAIANVETVRSNDVRGMNRGLGVFTFTPELGIPVWLKLASPTGAYSPLLVPENDTFPSVPAAVLGAPLVTASRTGFQLPEVTHDGVVMTVPDPVTTPGKPIRVHLRSVGRERKLVVGAYTRGRLSDTQSITATPGRVAEVRLLANADPRGGVVRVTVFEDVDQVVGQPKEDLKPVAERLIFRRPGDGLNLSFTTGPRTDNPGGFLPNSRIGLNLTATDEKGNPAAAILYAAVVNSAVASDAKDRLLTTHFLIAGEVSTPDSMEYADFLLTDHPKAAESLDLVLATQGWRRFAEQVPAGYARKPVAPSQEQANLLVCNGQYMTSVEPTSFKDHQKIRDLYWPRYEAAVRSLDAAKAAADAADADRTGAEGIQKLAAEANEARLLARAKAEQAEAAIVPVERFRETGWFAVGGFGLLAVMLGVAAFARPTGRLPLGISTMGAVGIVAFLVVALGTADQTHAAGTNNDAVGIPVARFELEPAVAPAPHARQGGEPKGGGARELETVVTGATGSDKDPNGFKAKTGAARDEQSLSDGKPQGPMAPQLGGVAGGGGGIGGSPMGFNQIPSNNGSQGGKGPGATPPGVMTVAPGFMKNLYPYAGGLNRFGPPRQAPADSDARPTAGAAAVPASPPTAKAPGGKPNAATLNAVLGEGGSQQQADSNRIMGEGGWQPRNAKKEISENELPDSGGHTFFRGRKDLGQDALAKFGAARRAGFLFMKGEAKADADAKERKADAEQYWGDVEKAKDFANKRSQDIQLHLREGLRQLKVQEEAQKQSLQDRSTEKAAMAPPAPGRNGAVAVPAETRAIYRVGTAVPTTHPLVVREYAAPRPGMAKAGKGEASPYEADTVLWQPVIVMPATGKLTLPVQLGSASGGYEVIIAGHTLDGRIGAVRGIIPIGEPLPANVNPSVPPAGNDLPNKP